MRALVHPETLAVLQYLEEKIPRWLYESQIDRRERQNLRSELPTRKLATIRARLLRFDDILAELQIEREPLYAEGDFARKEWFTYLEECKLIPVYDDAVALMRHRALVTPREISNILRFISVAGSSYGVDDAEDHGYGYHFHFGRVKKNTLRRVNLVLTFDNRKPVPQGSHDRLFAERHGSGRYKHIDVATVGQNVRYPVYTICEREMLSLGRHTFKNPDSKASIFY